jgi:hypothetical protein
VNFRPIWKSRYYIFASWKYVDGDCIRYIPPKAEGRQCGNAAISVYLYAFYNTSNNMQKKKTNVLQSRLHAKLCLSFFPSSCWYYYSGCTLHSGSLIASSSSRLCVLYAMACGQERESWTILTDYMKMNETKSKNKMKWRQFRHFEYYCTIISLWFFSQKKRNIYLYPPFFLHEQRGKWTMTVLCI